MRRAARAKNSDSSGEAIIDTEALRVNRFVKMMAPIRVHLLNECVIHVPPYCVDSRHREVWYYTLSHTPDVAGCSFWVSKVICF